MAFNRNGFGQVEPNQLSAQKTGQIYASLPLDDDVQILQNGEFMYYSYADKKVTAEPTVEGQEPMLVFNEIKLYEPFWRTSYKDFAMIRVGDNYVTSKLATAEYGENSDKNQASYQQHTDYDYRMQGIAPRMFKTNIGDIMTTNMVKELQDSGSTENNYEVGNLLVPVKNTATKTLQLEKFTPATAGDKPTGMAWVVADVYTMPDGQPGLKVQRIQ